MAKGKESILFPIIKVTKGVVVLDIVGRIVVHRVVYRMVCRVVVGEVGEVGEMGKLLVGRVWWW